MIGIFLGAFLTLITAWCLGRVLLRGLRVKLYRLEEDLLALLAGSACLSLVVFAFCSFHAARKGVFLVVFVVATGAVLWRRAIRPAPERLPRMPRLWLALFLAPFVVYAVIYFFNALAPDSSPEGSTHNLGNVVGWWRDRGFAADTRGMYPNRPQGMGMLFLFAFSFGKHSAATLVHFAFLCALPWMMLCYGRRFGMVGPFVLGAMLVFLSPVAAAAGTSAYSDAARACTLFGLFYVLQIWAESRSVRLLVLAGLLAGFGFALDAGLLGVTYCILVVTWKLWHEGVRLLRAQAILAGCAAISMTPWIAGHWLWAPSTNVAALSKQLPVLWSLSGASVGGLFGPWLLLTPLGLVALRWKQGRRLLFAAALFALPVLENNSTRMLLPFAVFAAPALGLAVERSPGMLPALLILHCLVSWPSAVSAYADSRACRIDGMPLEAATRSIPEDKYLESRVSGYNMARAIDQLTAKNARVLTLVQIPQAYTTRRIWKADESAKGQLAMQSILAASQPGWRPVLELRFRLTGDPVRGLRVVAADRMNAVWTVNEMRLYRAGAEIQRQPSWRVSAKPNARYAPRAFDNSDVTAWSTWRAIEPGMYLEEDFDQAIRVDTVALISPQQDPRPNLRVDGLGDDGKWRTLSTGREFVERLPPAGLRRAANEELKALDFDYIVARRDTEPGLDMYRNASFWGISLIQAIGGMCLYHLD